jgi:hypothetical protein
MAWFRRIAPVCLLLAGTFGSASLASSAAANQPGYPGSPPTAPPAATAIPTAAPPPAPTVPPTPPAQVSAPVVSVPIVITGAGDVTGVVNQYRDLLGPNNGGEPGSRGAGRREINWDGVPDNLSAPNFMPNDFFNGPEAPRARGAVFSTPGSGVQVSADADNPDGADVRFGNINPTYSSIFQAFSEERLFSPIDSNIVEMTFRVPGTDTPAAVRGFGAVYTDVDTDHTAFEYFDVAGNSLGTFAVPIADNGLSFLGVVFDRPIVARVRIEYGTVALGPDDSAQTDVSVMDDFIYGEPVAIGN